jgi:hypothetical protein
MPIIKVRVILILFLLPKERAHRALQPDQRSRVDGSMTCFRTETYFFRTSLFEAIFENQYYGE